MRWRHGYNPNTFFDADRCAGGVQRAIDFDELAAIDVAEDKVPKWDVIFVVINSPLIAGSSPKKISAFSTASPPGDSERSLSCGVQCGIIGSANAIRRGSRDG